MSRAIVSTLRHPCSMRHSRGSGCCILSTKIRTPMTSMVRISANRCGANRSPACRSTCSLFSIAILLTLQGYGQDDLPLEFKHGSIFVLCLRFPFLIVWVKDNSLAGWSALPISTDIGSFHCTKGSLCLLEVWGGAMPYLLQHSTIRNLLVSILH